MRRKRADKASDLLELRTELEKIEKTAVSQQNKLRRGTNLRKVQHASR